SEHLTDFVLHTEPDAFEIDGEGLVPVFFGVVGGKEHLSGDAGIVEGAVEAAPFRNGRGDERFAIGSGRDIGFAKFGFAAGPADHRDSLFAASGRDIGNEDFGSFSSEDEGGGAADAAAGAGHESYFVG